MDSGVLITKFVINVANKLKLDLYFFHSFSLSFPFVVAASKWLCPTPEILGSSHEFSLHTDYSVWGSCVFNSTPMCHTTPIVRPRCINMCIIYWTHTFFARFSKEKGKFIWFGFVYAGGVSIVLRIASTECSRVAVSLKDFQWTVPRVWFWWEICPSRHCMFTFCYD